MREPPWVILLKYVLAGRDAPYVWGWHDPLADDPPRGRDGISRHGAADGLRDRGDRANNAMKTSHNTASTAIVNLTYDDETEELFMTFKDGRNYVIANFPEIELERWLGSASIGGYFNAFVRGNY